MRGILGCTIANAVAIALGTAVSTAYAQEATRFSLPAQPLADSLKAIANQTSTNVLVDLNLISGVKAPSLNAELTPEKAIEQLLRGTGFTYEIVNDHTIVLEKGREEVDKLKKVTSPGVAWNSGTQQPDGDHSLSPSQGEGPDKELNEIVVTASRRKQTLEEVPYSITAISGEQLANTGVTDMASLISQVPGLSMYDLGARATGYVFPIIRGLNTDSPLGFRAFAQPPVGVYIGNSPIDGYFQLEDVQRVEVLRGPQGTLYGAGALGGTLRIIPNAPVLGLLSGNLEFGGGSVDHASSASYTAGAMLNVPIGDTLAFRASGKFAYEPGFINVYGILKRTGPFDSAIPVLANPADPVNSSGVFTGKSDWNDQNTFTGRASFLWKPADNFNAELAFTYSNLNGDGARAVNPNFSGGAYPIDPRITFPRGGINQVFSATDQPFSRRSALTSLDLSYDAGFATVSSTSSYATTSGFQADDGTYVETIENPQYGGYYAGNPINPRFVEPGSSYDKSQAFTQEIRLVSNSGPDRLLDYVVGVFYENQQRDASQSYSNPGSPERSIAQGCTAPYFYGAQFPNCLPAVGPNDLVYVLNDSQHFRDISEFGELTWHFVTHGQITFGGRHFEQSFSDAQIYNDWTFALFVPPNPQNARASKNTFKINPSYEFLPGQHVYALWSQGFRRGGVNAVPTAGFLAEYPSILTYGPDTVNNYETGLKGHFSNGLTYAFDVFDIQWDNPQIEGGTPAFNYAVWNAKKARSTGAELDISAALPLPGLSISAGGAYAHARLTEDYLIKADAFGNITGTAGQQLPGSPKVSAVATLNYKHSLAPGYDLAVSLNETYRSAMALSLPRSGAGTAASGANIANVSASVSHRSWRLGAYVTNFTDKRVVITQGFIAGSLADNYYINQPRELSVRLAYSF